MKKGASAIEDVRWTGSVLSLFNDGAINKDEEMSSSFDSIIYWINCSA